MLVVATARGPGRTAVRRYADQPFQVRVSLAADGPVSDVLAQWVADTVSPGDGVTVGPAVVVRPSADELRTAWCNVTTLGFAPLPVAHLQGLPADAVGDLERTLGAIADVDEVAGVFRLSPPTG